MSELSPGNKVGPTRSSASGHAAPPLAFWLRGIVFLGAFLLLVGAGVAVFQPAMLVGSRDEISGAVKIYAGYFASRNLALAILLLVAMSLRARQVLSGLLLFASLIQMVDAVMDGMEHRWAVAPGVVVLGLLFAFAASRISGSPFWRAEAWSRN